MLTRIDLRWFKCFSRLKLPLCPLTLLSGPNASGKSSVLQAFALLHQTMREQEWSSRLVLNGSVVRLGTVGDVVDQVYGRSICDIHVLDEDAEYRWKFEGERSDMTLSVKRVYVGGVGDWAIDGSLPLHYLLPDHVSSSSGSSLVKRLRGLAYLTAERLGPRETYPLEDLQLDSVVGAQGEHAVSVLHSGRDARVRDGLVIDGVPPTRLRQVGARMSSFFPGCELAIEKVPQANSVTLGLRTSQSMEFHRPIHAGFGLTQVLPIVVAALSAGQDDLLLMENPEVHLHPAGQGTMGEFLAEVAASGVQVILETHSDHVLNGIRRAVKKRILRPLDAALHFFQARQNDGQERAPQVISPTLDGDGNVDTWPVGFFDQFDKDMNYFAGWR